MSRLHNEPTWKNQLWHARRVLAEKGREALDNPHAMIGRTCGCNVCFTCAAAQVVAEHDWKHASGTRSGTCHFRSREAAVKYYAIQGISAGDVDLKHRSREIGYGPPRVNDGQQLLLNPEEGRYFIGEVPIMSHDTQLKQQICDALEAWVNKRPKFGEEQVSASERREVSRDKRDALTFLAVIRNRDSITVEHLQAAFAQAFSGRLECHINPTLPEKDRVRLEYTQGQYGPVEYRAAAASVLAYTLRYNVLRHDMPPATFKQSANGHVREELRDGLSPGAWVRRYFRREFGSRMQRSWFN